VENRFQSLPFKRNLQRYDKVNARVEEYVAGLADASTSFAPCKVGALRIVSKPLSQTARVKSKAVCCCYPRYKPDKSGI
jgi:hypothetical protein